MATRTIIDSCVGVPRKTLDDLQWERIVQAISSRRRLAPVDVPPEAAIPLAASHEEMCTSLEETREATTLAASGEPLPLDGLRDIRPFVDRVEKQGVLDGPALRDVAAMIGAARTLRRFLAARRARTPRLAEVCASDPTLDGVEDDLSAAIAPDGTIFDHASEELRKLRTETANLRGRLVARLDELVTKHRDLLSDGYHTLREGRYVLPVRADAHERVHGIVHGASGSGATLFVEPRALVPFGNRLKIAEAEMQREEARILAGLSDVVRDQVPSLRAAIEALERADLRNACAVLGRDLDATFPKLVPDARISLHTGRHPVLLLDGATVVSNDVSVTSGSALVVSGPNAGGKTVAMKLVGLCALMARAGIPVPAGDGSECGFFAEILTDVGDEQSITKNLSTFSAHVTNLVRVLGGAGPRSLVLLDELAGGTDPDEGAALACAVVSTLCTRGACVIVTTHYEPLKALALEDARLKNAAVGFDVEHLAPTFELMLGVPGASSALGVAARFGLPAEVVADAKRRLPDRTRGFDDLARRLEAEWHALSLARTQAENDARTAAASRRDAEELLAKARTKEQTEVSSEADRLLTLVKTLREELGEARAKLRHRPDAESLAGAVQAADRANRAVALGGELDSASPTRTPETVDAPVVLGQHVWIARLRIEAEVIEGPTRGRIRVAAGPLKLWIDVAEAKGMSAAKAPAKNARAKPTPSRSVSIDQSSDTNDSIDVRGMRVDDALALVDAFVDRLYGASASKGFVTHGIGTGALRDAVRDHLCRAAQYVASVRAGAADEGGDRVTVLFLR